ncbi:unnamed protein product [Symbiodinium natans]|uniref:Uncharacterized protein n=1 Tax=Symbiodinium natans TaxID=878477 RepID=A0A812UA32_9DINO|nr:unnamed protein product [Symbiodinium natans]
MDAQMGDVGLGWRTLLKLSRSCSSMEDRVQVGNESEIEALYAVAEGWGKHCDWLAALLPSPAYAVVKQRHGEEHGNFQALRVEGANSMDVWDVLQLTMPTVDDFSQGTANLLCSFRRPWMFFMPENLKALLDEKELSPSGEVNVFCAGRMACQTRRALAAPRLHQPLWPPLCGGRVEDICHANLTQPVAIHAPNLRALHGLQAAFYHGWAFRCPQPLRVAGRLPVGRGNPPRVAILIGSLLRGLHMSRKLLSNLFLDWRLHYWVFIYTSPLVVTGKNDVCGRLLNEIVSQSPRIKVQIRFATRAENLQEQEFERAVSSRHMRQWYKLQQSYQMMQAHEQKHGREFDLVLKMRTDMTLMEPIDLSSFPDVLTSRVIYSFTDLLFLSRRDVAHSLLGDVTKKMASFAGDQRRLYPLDFARVLRRGLGDGLRLQMFPDVGSTELREAIQENKFLRAQGWLRRFKHELMAAQEAAVQGEDVPTFTGHWRFRPDTWQYQAWKRDGRLAPDKQMCSVTRWFYLIHRTDPEITIQEWPHVKGRKILRLFPERFASNCNCEPPHCWPMAWGPAPEGLLEGVDWIQTPSTGVWLSLRAKQVGGEPGNHTNASKPSME